MTLRWPLLNRIIAPHGRSTTLRCVNKDHGWDFPWDFESFLPHEKSKDSLEHLHKRNSRVCAHFELVGDLRAT